MAVESSKYGVFLDNYNKGFSEYLNNISGNFFDQIAHDVSNIKDKAEEGSELSGKISQIDAWEKNNADNYTKLKLIGKILQDVAPNVISSNNYEIKRSGANIINGFFTVAKQTGDEELLKTAASISGTVKNIQSKTVPA